MFSLIITVISIALVAALAVSTLYFGGDAFNQGTSEARANTLINQATQIDAARQLYRAGEGTGAGDVTALVNEGYLASAPELDDEGWDIDNNGASDDKHTFDISALADAEDVCDAVNENDSTLYSCDDGDGETFEFGG